MHKGRGVFGKSFEEKGDLPKAFDAYRSAGLEDEAIRVRSKIETLEIAKKLEAHRLYGRCVDTLIDGGLVKEAAELAKRIEKADTPESNYVQMRVLSLSGYSESMERPFRKLRAHGPYGHFLLGMSIADAMPEVARRFADGLSGVERVQDKEDSHGCHVFICGGADAEAISEQMLAITFWGMEDPNESRYFAMRIYQRMGDSAEAGRCLAELPGERGNFRFFDIMRKGGGVREVVERCNDFDEHRRMLFALIRGQAGKVLDAIDCFDNTEEEKYDYSGTLLYEIERLAPDLLDLDQMEALLSFRERKKEILAKGEEQKLAEAGELIAKGDFSSIVEAREKINKVNFKYLRGGLGENMLKCADAARKIGSAEALKFAGGIYKWYHEPQKAMECAQSLLEMGAIGPARELFSGVASSVFNSIHDGMKHSSDDPVSENLRDALMEAASGLEGSHPAVSLSIYRELHEFDGVLRVAKHILEHGSEKDIQQAAWAVSLTDKKSILMRDLLLKLEGFGDEGTKYADGIRNEMRVPRVFLAR